MEIKKEEQPQAEQSQPEQPQAGQSQPEQPQAGQSRPEQPQTEQSQPEQLLNNRYRMLEILRIDGTGDRYAKYTVADTQNEDKVMVAKEMLIPMVDREEREQMISRFLTQGKKFMEINHPSLCNVTDCFVEKGCLYLIMEHIQGEYLDEILQNYLMRSNSALSEKQVIEVSFRICEALEFLHGNDILSGTLQPTNIMFSREAGRLVLIDFGISRILIPEPEKNPIYTPGFSPPEQYEGIIEPRSDIYSLGAIMHYLLSGIDPKLYNVPFTYPPLRSIREELSREVEALVAKALQKDMANRFNSAAEYKGALGVVYQSLAKKFVTKASWTMFRGDISRTGSQGDPLKGTPRFLWKYKTGKGTISCPCVVGDKIYLSAYENYLYAINLKDGSVLWEYKVRGQLSSSPAIYDGALYVGCMDCNLYSLDINAISLRWKYKTDGLITSSPAIYKDTVFIGSYDSHFYAVDINGGRMKWKFNASGTVMSSPVLDDDVVYFASLDSNLYAVNSESGELLWKFKTNYSISSSPSIYDNKIFVGSYDGCLYCVDKKTGRKLWDLNTHTTITTCPPVSDGVVYIGNHSGKFFAVDVESGKPLWGYSVSQPFLTSPAISGGKVYFCAEESKIFIMEAKTGQLLDCLDAGVPFSTSPTISDGILLLGTADGFLYAFK